MSIETVQASVDSSFWLATVNSWTSFAVEAVVIVVGRDPFVVTS
jgi:hypothetical protein